MVLSQDLRQRIFRAVTEEGQSRRVVAQRFGVSPNTVQNLIKLHRQTGTLDPQWGPGRPPKLTSEQVEAVIELVSEEPDLIRREIIERLQLDCDERIISKVLIRNGITRKKSLKATEQQREDVVKKRRAWPKRLKKIPRKRLVFLDETGAQTNLTRLYGRAPSDQRVPSRKPAGHYQNVTMISAIRQSQIVSSMVFKGACDTIAFCVYPDKFLLPELNIQRCAGDGQPPGSQNRTGL